MSHLLRFGVATVLNTSWKTLVKRWRFIEQVGFDSIWVPDHFTVWFRPYVDMPWFEAWTTLSSLATQTSRIRIGGRQTIETLISEEALLLAKLLRDERKTWIPRIAALSTSTPFHRRDRA
jgi:hypothetical protein